MPKKNVKRPKAAKASMLATEKGRLAMRLGDHEIELSGVKFKLRALSSSVDAFILDSATRMIEDTLTNPAGEPLLDAAGEPRVIQYPKEDSHAKSRLSVAFGVVGWSEGLVGQMPDGSESPIEYAADLVKIAGKDYPRIREETLEKLTPLINILAG